MARQNTDIIYSQKLKEKMHSNVIFLRLSWWSWILTIFGALSLAGGRKLWVWNGLVIMPRWQWPPAPGTCSKQSPHYSSQVIRLEERPARPPPWLCLSRKRPRNLWVVFMPLVKLKHTQAGRGCETKHWESHLDIAKAAEVLYWTNLPPHSLIVKRNSKYVWFLPILLLWRQLISLLNRREKYIFVFAPKSFDIQAL